jgi:hypothetical protein
VYEVSVSGSFRLKKLCCIHRTLGSPMHNVHTQNEPKTMNILNCIAIINGETSCF